MVALQPCKSMMASGNGKQKAPPTAHETVRQETSFAQPTGSERQHSSSSTIEFPMLQDIRSPNAHDKSCSRADLLCEGYMQKAATPFVPDFVALDTCATMRTACARLVHNSIMHLASQLAGVHTWASHLLHGPSIQNLLEVGAVQRQQCAFPGGKVGAVACAVERLAAESDNKQQCISASAILDSISEKEMSKCFNQVCKTGATCLQLSRPMCHGPLATTQGAYEMTALDIQWKDGCSSCTQYVSLPVHSDEYFGERVCGEIHGQHM
jgi:hypothetical protein